MTDRNYKVYLLRKQGEYMAKPGIPENTTHLLQHAEFYGCLAVAKAMAINGWVVVSFDLPEYYDYLEDGE